MCSISSSNHSDHSSSSSSFSFSLFGVATARKYFPLLPVDFVSFLSSNPFHVFSCQIHVSPNSILAMLRIISATLCQSSFAPSIPLLITSILNLFFTFKSFSFHHFILFTDFGAFLHFDQMIIALTSILCCFATLSLTITFVSTTSLILLLLTIM